MIEGQFTDELPVVTTVVTGTASSQRVNFLVDTGFNGEIVLNRSVASRLGLNYIGPRTRRLADGSRRTFSIHVGTIDWVNGQQNVEGIITEGHNLLGTGLILGSVLTVEGVEGGLVTIEPS